MFLLKPNSSLLLSSADYTRFAIFLSLLSSYASCIWSIWKASGKTVQEDFFIQSFQLWSDSYFGVSFDFFLFLFLEILIFISYFLTCSFGKLPLFAPISFWSLLWFFCMFCFFFVSIRYHNFFYFSIWNIV